MGSAGEEGGAWLVPDELMVRCTGHVWELALW